MCQMLGDRKCIPASSSLGQKYANSRRPFVGSRRRQVCVNLEGAQVVVTRLASTGVTRCP